MENIYRSSDIVKLSDLSQSILDNMKVTIQNMYGVHTAENAANAIYKALNVSTTDYLKDSQTHAYSAIENLLHEVNPINNSCYESSIYEEMIRPPSSYVELIRDSQSEYFYKSKWLEEIEADSISAIQGLGENVAVQNADLVYMAESTESSAAIAFAEINSRLIGYKEVNGLPMSYMDMIESAQLDVMDKFNWLEDISVAPMSHAAIIERDTQAMVGNLALASSIHNGFMESHGLKEFDTLKGFKNIANATKLSETMIEGISVASKATDQFTETLKSLTNTPENMLAVLKPLSSMEDSAFNTPPAIEPPRYEIDMPIIDFDPKKTPHYKQQEELITHIKEGNKQNFEKEKRNSEEKIIHLKDSKKKHYQMVAISVISLIIAIIGILISNSNKDSEFMEVKQKNKVTLNKKEKENQDLKVKHMKEVGFLKQELSEKNIIIKELLLNPQTKKSVNNVVK